MVLAVLPKAKESLASDLKNVARLEAVSIVSLVDEIRPNIEKVLSHFAERSIHLKIVSGDAPETVRSVAERSGWRENLDRVVTGEELDQMKQDDLDKIAKECSLFARVSPQNKKDLVTSLQKQKEYVSMVGDGVNDVLALKQSELGIAMNAGNRMSKDVSDIILLENDFTVMPEVFKEGHTILGNISSSAKLFLTKNMYAALLIAMCAFFDIAFPLVPRHVTMMGMFTITLPALLITFTKRMKYDPNHFLREILYFTFITGIIIASTGAFVLTVSTKYFGESIEVARTAMLTQVVVLTLLNFLLVLEPINPLKLVKEFPKLLAFVIVFLALYLTTLFTVTQQGTFDRLQEFLELEPLKNHHLIMTACLSILSGGLMIILHRWRAQKIKSFSVD